MARLTREESLALARVIVRAGNNLKGRLIDQARMAFPETKEDRQFKQFAKSAKDTESSIRHATIKALVEAGVMESLTNMEIHNMK